MQTYISPFRVLKPVVILLACLAIGLPLAYSQEDVLQPVEEPADESIEGVDLLQPTSEAPLSRSGIDAQRIVVIPQRPLIDEEGWFGVSFVSRNFSQLVGFGASIGFVDIYPNIHSRFDLAYYLNQNSGVLEVGFDAISVASITQSREMPYLFYNTYYGGGVKALFGEGTTLFGLTALAGFELRYEQVGPFVELDFTAIPLTAEEGQNTFYAPVFIKLQLGVNLYF